MPIKDPEARKLYNKQYFQSRKNTKKISPFSFTEKGREGFKVEPRPLQRQSPMKPLRFSVEPTVSSESDNDDFAELKDNDDDDFAELNDEPLKLMNTEDFVKQPLSEQEQDEYLFATDADGNLCFREDPLFLTNEFSRVLRQNNHDFLETLEQLSCSLILYVEKFDPHYKEIAELCFKKYNKIKSGLKDF